MRTIFVALILVVACTSAAKVLDVLGEPRFSALLGAASGEQNIVDFLNATVDAKITLFAPNNDALNGSSPSVNTLVYHGVNQTVMGTGNQTVLVDSIFTPATLGAPQRHKLVFVDGELAYVNGVQVVGVNRTSNGDVYEIGSVLALPANLSEVASSAGLSLLVAAVGAADLVSTLDSSVGITVFAPNDAAFGKYDSSVITFLTTTDGGKALLTKVLKNHVVPALAYSDGLPSTPVTPLLATSSLTIGGNPVAVNTYSKIIATDVFTNNGVVHVVDTVIVPKDLTLIELLAALNLTSLADALNTANLTDVLANTTSKFTLFAPTNAAFTAAGTVAPADLPAILKNHVLSGMVFSGDLMPTQNVMPLNAATTLVITASNGTVSINGNITVTIADQRAFNGVIHVIDKVITGSGETPPPTTAAPTMPTMPTTAAPTMPTMPTMPTTAPPTTVAPTMPVAPSSAFTVVFSAVLCAIVLAFSL